MRNEEWGPYPEAIRAPETKKRTNIDGDVFVSTIVHHMHPLIGVYETMILGGPHDGWERRTGRFSEALDDHDTAVRIARGWWSDKE